MSDVVFPALGAALFALGFAAYIGRRHVLWKIIAANVMASGVSMLLLTLPARSTGQADPVPQAMVLTGIVVMVASTGLALALAVRLGTAEAATAVTDPRAAPAPGESGAGASPQ